MLRCPTRPMRSAQSARAFNSVTQVGEKLFHVSLSTPRLSSFHLAKTSFLAKKPMWRKSSLPLDVVENLRRNHLDPYCLAASEFFHTSNEVHPPVLAGIFFFQLLENRCHHFARNAFSGAEIEQFGQRFLFRRVVGALVVTTLANIGRVGEGRATCAVGDRVVGLVRWPVLSEYDQKKPLRRLNLDVFS